MSFKIKFDNKNFNKHTDSGMDLLEKSINKVGIIESVTVSDDNVIISGNARHEKIQNKYDKVEPIVIETDGKTPIILKRTDIKSGTKEFHEAALLANTVSTKNINLDYDLIQEIAVDEFDIDIEEIGVDSISDFNVNIDSFFEIGDNERKNTEKLCPHCGKDINKNASEYEDHDNNEE